MSPRFERRPDKRTGTGGRGPARPAKPGRFGAGKPEWRPSADSPEGPAPRRSGAGASPERARPRFGERFNSRPGSGERPQEWRGQRPAPRDGERPSRRPADGDRFPRPDRAARFDGASRPDRAARPDRAPRPDRVGRPDRGPRPDRAATPDRFASGDRDRPAERQRSFDRFRPPGRSGGERDNRFAGRRESRPPVFEERREMPPQGESDTFGSSPPSDLIWGRHSAQAALESGRPIHRVWCTAELRHSPKFLQLLREAKASGVLVEEVTWARLGQLTGGAVHQGIALQSAAAETLDLTSLIEGCREIGEAPLLMAIDGLTDPHNLGAIVRSAEALGAHGMVLPQRRSAGLTGSVAKVAAGALEHLPVARVVNLNRALDALKQEGYRVVGLAGEGTVTLEEADLTGPLVVVTGSEAEGLSMLTRRTCDQVVRIPLRGATPSLNASVATALVVYEVARRGWMRGLSGHAPAPRLVRPQLPTAVTTPVVPPEAIPAAETEADAAKAEEIDAEEFNADEFEADEIEADEIEAAQAEAAKSDAAEWDAAGADLPALSEAPLASPAPVSEPEPEHLQPQAQVPEPESPPQAASGPESDQHSGSAAPDGSRAQELLSYGHPFQADITL